MKKILLMMILSVLALSMMACDASKYYEAVDSADTSMLDFTVQGGATTKGIAADLAELGLVQNDWSFVMLVKELNYDGKLQAGNYKLSKSMTAQEIAKVLAEGKTFVNTFKFTIPEGYEFHMIVDKLEAEGLIDPAKFEDLAKNYPFAYEFLEGSSEFEYRLEGYLFPATYELQVGATELDILTAMLDKFNSVFKAEYYTRAKELGMSVNEIITLASIIERECKVAEELPIISSVFHNRLEVDQQLQSCATIQYLLKERKEKLLNKDLEVDSPYNTYKYAGLPPAPIAMPGEGAIIAALYPDQTEYFYFVVSGDNDGKHQFSATYKEHLAAKEKAEKKLGN